MSGMPDIGSTLDLLFKVASEQPVTTTLADVRDLASEFAQAKSGKLTLASLSRDEAVKVLQQDIRTATLMLHLIQDKTSGDASFAEIKSLAGSLG